MKKEEWKPGMQFGSYIIDECREDGTFLTHCTGCGKSYVRSRPVLRLAKARNGVCRSCQVVKNNRNRATHGLTRAGAKHPKEVRVFCGILKRCYNPNDKDYPRYGARGIQVDAPWYINGHPNYSAFHEWYVAEEEKARQIYDEKYWGKLQVDRVNNEGNYSPDNCRLTTVKVQANNRRNTRYIDGLPLHDWYDEHKTDGSIQYKVFFRRVVQSGWDIERAISTPVKSRPKK